MCESLRQDVPVGVGRAVRLERQAWRLVVAALSGATGEPAQAKRLLSAELAALQEEYAAEFDRRPEAAEAPADAAGLARALATLRSRWRERVAQIPDDNELDVPVRMSSGRWRPLGEAVENRALRWARLAGRLAGEAAPASDD